MGCVASSQRRSNAMSVLVPIKTCGPDPRVQIIPEIGDGASSSPNNNNKRSYVRPSQTAAVSVPKPNAAKTKAAKATNSTSDASIATEAAVVAESSSIEPSGRRRLWPRRRGQQPTAATTLNNPAPPKVSFAKGTADPTNVKTGTDGSAPDGPSHGSRQRGLGIDSNPHHNSEPNPSNDHDDASTQAVLGWRRQKAKAASRLRFALRPVQENVPYEQHRNSPLETSATSNESSTFDDDDVSPQGDDTNNDYRDCLPATQVSGRFWAEQALRIRGSAVDFDKVMAAPPNKRATVYRQCQADFAAAAQQAAVANDTSATAKPSTNTPATTSTTSSSRSTTISPVPTVSSHATTNSHRTNNHGDDPSLGGTTTSTLPMSNRPAYPLARTKSDASEALHWGELALQIRGSKADLDTIVGAPAPERRRVYHTLLQQHANNDNEENNFENDFDLNSEATAADSDYGRMRVSTSPRSMLSAATTMERPHDLPQPVRPIPRVSAAPSTTTARTPQLPPPLSPTASRQQQQHWTKTAMCAGGGLTDWGGMEFHRDRTIVSPPLMDRIHNMEDYDENLDDIDDDEADLETLLERDASFTAIVGARQAAAARRLAQTMQQEQEEQKKDKNARNRGNHPTSPVQGRSEKYWAEKALGIRGSLADFHRIMGVPIDQRESVYHQCRDAPSVPNFLDQSDEVIRDEERLASPIVEHRNVVSDKHKNAVLGRPEPQITNEERILNTHVNASGRANDPIQFSSRSQTSSKRVDDNLRLPNFGRRGVDFDEIMGAPPLYVQGSREKRDSSRAVDRADAAGGATPSSRHFNSTMPREQERASPTTSHTHQQTDSIYNQSRHADVVQAYEELASRIQSGSVDGRLTQRYVMAQESKELRSIANPSVVNRNNSRQQSGQPDRNRHSTLDRVNLSPIPHQSDAPDLASHRTATGVVTPTADHSFDASSELTVSPVDPRQTISSERKAPSPFLSLTSEISSYSSSVNSIDTTPTRKNLPMENAGPVKNRIQLLASKKRSQLSDQRKAIATRDPTIKKSPPRSPRRNLVVSRIPTVNAQNRSDAPCDNGVNKSMDSSATVAPTMHVQSTTLHDIPISQKSNGIGTGRIANLNQPNYTQTLGNPAGKTIQNSSNFQIVEPRVPQSNIHDSTPSHKLGSNVNMATSTDDDETQYSERMEPVAYEPKHSGPPGVYWARKAFELKNSMDDYNMVMRAPQWGREHLYKQCKKKMENATFGSGSARAPSSTTSVNIPAPVHKDAMDRMHSTAQSGGTAREVGRKENEVEATRRLVHADAVQKKQMNQQHRVVQTSPQHGSSNNNAALYEPKHSGAPGHYWAMKALQIRNSMVDFDMVMGASMAIRESVYELCLKDHLEDQNT